MPRGTRSGTEKFIHAKANQLDNYTFPCQGQSTRKLIPAREREEEQKQKRESFFQKQMLK